MVLSSDFLLAAYTPQANIKCNFIVRHLAEQVKPRTGQDDCKVFFYPLMVSLSNHRRIERASFDKLRMSRNR